MNNGKNEMPADEYRNRIPLIGSLEKCDSEDNLEKNMSNDITNIIYK